MKVAVIGAGWAGLAAAVRAQQAGHAVTVFESAPMPGGRARSDKGDDGGDAVDNGQHILLGGYARTLALMREVGVDVDLALLRLPLSMTYPDGSGFALARDGRRLVAAVRALAGARGFTWGDKLSLVAMSLAWQARRFRCADALTVDALLRRTATARVRTRLVEPLCVAALNTPSSDASAAVFLAVMRDSLFGARDASDLLLPQRPLADLLPLPAVAWLRQHGARVHLRRRVTALRRSGDGWVLGVGGTAVAGASVEPASASDNCPSTAGNPFDDDSLRFDRVILAVPPLEAARLAQKVAPDWAATAAGLAHEPIVTLTLLAPKRPWPAAMLALASDDSARPAQFAFKLGAQPEGRDRITLVVSAASAWLERGLEGVTAAAIAQYRAAFAIADDEPVTCASARADRRATFRCAAGVVRPGLRVAPGLVAAGDHVDGPYPATLEAAVLAGEAAAATL